MFNAVVLTPTIGRDSLLDSIISVQSQTEIPEHLIVVDGPQHLDKVDAILEQVSDHSNITKMVLPYNTGYGGYFGHRVIAAVSQIINHDYMFILDDDNWYENNHVATMLDKLVYDELDWCFSLRKIWTHDKRKMFFDTAIAIGDICPVIERTRQIVDTSTYVFKNKFIKDYGHLWYGGYGADQRFFQNLAVDHKHDTTGLFTLNYKLDPTYTQAGMVAFDLTLSEHNECEHFRV